MTTVYRHTGNGRRRDKATGLLTARVRHVLPAIKTRVQLPGTSVLFDIKEDAQIDCNYKRQNRRNRTFTYLEEMTRSAPPARTSTKISSKSRSSSDNSVSLSIDDIYQSAERERLNYSAQYRRQNLEHAQSQFQYFREDSRMSSRPNTSASRYMYINSSRRDIYTPVSVWSEPVLSRPSSTIRHPELRGLDEYDDEDDEEYAMSEHYMPISVTVSPVSRDCCEIIGPQMCHECRKNRIRQLGRENSNALFPNLQLYQENFTTTAIAKKYLPGLSYSDIEDKLARGEIAKPSFLKKTTDGTADTKHKGSAKKVTILDSKDTVTDKPPPQDHKRLALSDSVQTPKNSPESPGKQSALYFSNIRDLNYKIITGTAERNIGFRRKTKEKQSPAKIRAPPKNHFPTFISPRKVPLTEDAAKYKAYYEPPLVAKESQSVEPAFFAGSSSNYKLPEKLPEELVFVDKQGNQQQISNTKRISSQLAIISDSPILEEESETETPEPHSESSMSVIQEKNSRMKGTLEEEEEEEEKVKEKEEEVIKEDMNAKEKT